MTDVDPFIIRIPDKFIDDPEVAPYFEYLNRFLHDIWFRTGGSSDSVDELFNINTSETTPTSASLNGVRKEIEHLRSHISVLNGRLASLESAATNQPYMNTKGSLYKEKLTELENLSIIKQGQ